VLVQRFGIAGAGAARLVSTGISTAAALVLLTRSFAKGELVGPRAWPRFDRSLSLQLAWNGAVFGLQVCAGSLLVSSFPLFLAARRASAEPLAVTSVLFGAYLFVSAPCLAVSQAVGSAVGGYLGGGNLALAKRTARHGVEVAGLWATASAVAFLLGGELLVRANLGRYAERAEVQAAVSGIAAYCLFDGIALALVLLGTIRAAGRKTLVAGATIAGDVPYAPGLAVAGSAATRWAALDAQPATLPALLALRGIFAPAGRERQ
jgi:Na+-driven multidrug efflux pump